MQRRARILYVVNNPAFFVSHRLPLAREARERGYDVHVATPMAADVERIQDQGYRHHALRLDRGSLRPDREMRTLADFVRLYRKVRPDLLHHITIKPVLYGGMAARWLRVPAVVHGVTGLGWVFGKDAPRLLRQAVLGLYRLALGHPNSRAIFQNPDDLAAFTDGRLLRPDQSVLIKGSGVDTRLYSPRPEPEGTPVVLLASRMLWEKGVGEFVEAAQRLRAEGLSARFVLAGVPDPANPRAIPDEALRGWHAEGAVEWWGQRDDMPSVFAGVHLVCLPSYYGEGVPRVLIEASACGRAVITTDTPGCREIVHDRENGLLVPPRDVDALVEALRTLLADSVLRGRMAQAGRERATSEFGLEHVVSATLEVYDELLKSAAG